MAAIGTQSLLWLVMAVATLAALAGAAFGIWSLRPVPEYSSEGITEGSPFAVTFRVENASPWFSLSRLKISCALTDMPPVDANGPRPPASLGPRETATFTCPFQSDDLDVALRSELYFRSEYDVPAAGSVRLADDRGPFILNTKLWPPRWTGKPSR